MNEIFVDTGYWIALINSDDALHRKAAQIAPTLANRRLITTDLVLNELLNGLSKRGRLLRQSAVATIRRLQQAPNVEIVLQTPALFDRALNLYRDRPELAWSHTDCVSFCLMDDRQIHEALAHDHHFEQAGFLALLRAEF